MNANRSLRWRK